MVNTNTMSNHESRSRKRLKGWKPKIILILASVLIFFAGAETVLRLVGFEFAPIQNTVPSRKWFGYPPNYRGPGTGFPGHWIHYNVRINSHGLRGPHIPKKKHKRVFRIIALGDSCTFGAGLNEELTYPRKLEVILKERFPKRGIEVINAGVMGYSSFNGLKYLECKLLEFDPDLVIVCFGWNDLWFGVMTDKDKWVRSAASSDTGDALDAVSWSKHLASNSRLYQFLTKGLFSLKYKLGFQGAVAPGDLVRAVPIEDYERNLQRIVSLARSRDSRVLLLTSPSAVDPRATPKEWWIEKSQGSMEEAVRLHGEYNAVARKVAAKLNAPLVDCEALFDQKISDKPAYRTELLFPDGIHLLGPGCQIIAEVLADAIISNKIMER